MRWHAGFECTIISLMQLITRLSCMVATKNKLWSLWILLFRYIFIIKFSISAYKSFLYQIWNKKTKAMLKQKVKTPALLKKKKMHGEDCHRGTCDWKMIVVNAQHYYPPATGGRHLEIKLVFRKISGSAEYSDIKVRKEKNWDIVVWGNSRWDVQ